MSRTKEINTVQLDDLAAESSLSSCRMWLTLLFRQNKKLFHIDVMLVIDRITFGNVSFCFFMLAYCLARCPRSSTPLVPHFHQT